MTPGEVNAFGREPGGCVWRFADCEFDERRHELCVRGTPVELEVKPLEVLHQLLINAGEVVTKQELFASVWPDVMVVDGSLATAVSKLRKALGDEDVVITVPRIGYRLGCAVETSVHAGPPLAPLALKPGDAVPGRGQWRLSRRFDALSSNQVWLAEQPKTHAVRVFKFATDDVQLRGLKREVTLARVLREGLGERPNFVEILEWNFDTRPYFIESDYAGPNLAEWAAAQGGCADVPLAVRLQLLIEITRAVADAHSLGVLHKDLKPGNILIAQSGDYWLPKIADFGSGTLLDLSRLGVLGITNAGFTRTDDANEALTGTMLYIAPEVLAGQSPSPVSDVYALGVLLYQFLIGDFRRPLSPGWEAQIEDPLLRSDIAEAACGDPGRRLRTAAELGQRLSTLGTRRAQHAEAERNRLRAEALAHSHAFAHARRPWIVLALLAMLVAVAAIASLGLRHAQQAPRGKSIAVLPFENAGGEAASDFLRFALPDEIATTLSHMRGLSIRPFTSTEHFAGASVDLQNVGREAQVSSIVTGHYLHVGDTLQITIEVVDVEHQRLLWRDTVNVPNGNLVALQAQVSAIVRGKMGAALGASEFVGEYYAPPKNEKAYNLYLRTQVVAPNLDTRANEDAIKMLEQSVALDPSYAPAWNALALRLYGAARFEGGGERLLQRSDEALLHALAADPDSIDAASEFILHRAERGDLEGAYQQARTLLTRRPDSAQAHSLMGYVLRYAGLLEESAKQCDAGAQLDFAWPSCSTTYMLLGDYAHARAVLRPDLGSEWSRAHGIEILLRQGRTEEALRLDPPLIPGWDSYRMLLACARHSSSAEIASLAATIKPDGDPEVSYLFAGHLAYCSQSAAAIRMLKNAVAGHFCSYPAIDSDPFFNSIRSAPEFAEVRRSAIACRSEFLKTTNAAQ
jgi:DNA-binding winged helix-turn-helix (wHTH) protein/serine/threonine protein kinase